MKTKELTISIVSIVACCMGNSAFSATNTSAANLNESKNNTPTLQEFRLNPAINFWGFTGDNTYGEGQVRLPLYGSSSNALYFLGEGSAVSNNDGWLAGGGFGYRQVVNKKRIFGAYALGDYANTENNNGFWVLNPGLEMLGTAWDLDINGYFPISDKEKARDQWADQLLNDPNLDARSFIRHTSHDEYAHKFRIYEEMGDGFSVDIGRVVPHINNAKVYVGAYYFNPDDDDIKGVNAKITYDLNKYASLEAKDYYDNANHNQFLIGLKLTLGGYSKEEKRDYGISTRLMDPIENDFAQFTSDSESFTRTKYEDQGEFHEHDNLWFFEPDTAQSSGDSVSGVSAGAPIGDGTYENPYIGFNEANFSNINPNIGTIDPFPLMYFATGNYSFATFTDSLGNEDRFDLPQGWGMYGKSADYIDSEMAYFSGGLDMNYISDTKAYATTLDSIAISDTQQDSLFAALYVNAARNIILRNVNIYSDIETDDVMGITSYGIYGDNNSVITLEGETNTIFASGSFTSTGIFADNGTTINFNSGTNNITGIGNDYGYGIDAGETNAAAINFNGGVNNVYGQTSNDINGITSYGIYADNNSTITFDGGASTVTASGSFTSTGIFADNGSTINFNSGTNNITGIGNDYGYGIDAGVTNTAAVNFNGGTNNVHGQGLNDNYGFTSYGVYADNNSTITFGGGASTVLGSGSFTSTGIFADNGSTINFNSGTNNVIGMGDDFGYGMDAGVTNAATINFNGGTNNVYGQTPNIFGDAIGIFGAHGGGSLTINFNDGTNTVYGSGAYGNDGIAVWQSSTINFNGGCNTVYGSGTAGGFNEGIDLENSTLNFNGGRNTVYGQNSQLTSYNVGITAPNGVINFNDGTNVVYGRGDIVGDSSIQNIGIDAGSSVNTYGAKQINFNGGQNTVYGYSTAGTPYTTGISLDYGAVATFNGGTNTVYGENTSNIPGGTAYGIFAAGSYESGTATINFEDGTNSVYGISGSTAYGIYGGYLYPSYYTANAIINFDNGNNSVYGTTTGDASGYGNAYGIYLVSNYSGISTIAFNGGTNDISGTGGAAYSGTGYGVYVDNGTTVNFNNGTNSITGTGTADSGSVSAYGVGIFADNSTGDAQQPTAINFNGGMNQVTGYGIAGAGGSGTGFGIYAGPSYGGEIDVNLNAGTNNISGNGEGDKNGTRGNGIGYGIYAVNEGVYSTFINFNGGINNIYATGVGGSDPTFSNSQDWGIYSDYGSNINFNNGTNTINATSNGVNSSAIGIYAGTSSVTFAGGINTINAIANNNINAIAVGLYADYGAVINFNDGTNNINATSTGFSSFAYGIEGNPFYGINYITFSGGINNVSAISNGDFSVANGLYGSSFAYGSNSYVLSGGINTINAQSTGAYSNAYGVFLEGFIGSASIEFDGGTNNISAQSDGANSIAYGIYSLAYDSSSSVTFNDGVNTISATSSADYSTAYGIYGTSTYGTNIVTFVDGTNNINATATGANAIAYGIDNFAYSGNSSLNFNGGINTIDATSNGANSIAYGIYGDSSYGMDSITFTNGTNNINATATGANAIAYGIYATGSHTSLNFSYDPTTTFNVVNITANGDSAQYGIYVDDGANMYDYNNLEMASGSELEQYVNFMAPATNNGKEAVYVGKWSQDWP